MQIHACYTCTALYKAAGQKKGFKKAKDRHTKAAGQAAAVWVNEPAGMQNHNVPAFDVLLPVPVVLPVRFPAVAVR